MPQHVSSCLLTISLCLLASCLCACTPVSASDGKPLVMAITKDEATSLYTVALTKDGKKQLVLDLSGPLIWSTCDDASHPALQPHERECTVANRYTSPGCWAALAGCDAASSYYDASGKCVAHPVNPFTGKCACGDLTRAALSANATDGKNPLHPVSFPAVASCAPASLLDSSLPAGAAGVAGLGRSELALPAQVASGQGVARKFALCLPSLAVFGGGPLFLTTAWREVKETTSAMSFTPLRRNLEQQAGYHIWIKGISVPNRPMVGGGHGPLVVGFSLRIPYMAVRPDLYRLLVQAYDSAAAAVGTNVTEPVAPLKHCYDKHSIWSTTRAGYGVFRTDLVLEDGTLNVAAMAQPSDDRTLCLAFVEMEPEKLGYGGYGQAPAIVLGRYQMEENLLVFDEEKQQLGFIDRHREPWYTMTSCTTFNFTMAA